MPWKYAQMKLPKLINSTIFENNFFFRTKSNDQYRACRLYTVKQRRGGKRLISGFFR